MSNYERESNTVEEENLNGYEIIEFGDEQFVEPVEQPEEPNIAPNNEGNIDYIDHHNTGENLRDGDPS
jgi:hypothetical protein